jgi:hypothetical protein
MEALVKSNERIQTEKLKMEERMETRRIKSHANSEKEERELQHKNVQAIGGIIKDIVHNIAHVFQPMPFHRKHPPPSPPHHSALQHLSLFASASQYQSPRHLRKAMFPILSLTGNLIWSMKTFSGH